ncbi:hypothetical protein ANO11243_043480 [Dothideomycetidae sp. 11243]|nr:hypothetical protein ANO11243_043480 [fungal sp. No.11243]
MEGKQLDLFLCAIIIGVISTVVVGLRCATRLAIRGFWVDDWLMVVSQILTIAMVVTAAVGATQGIGVLEADFKNPDEEIQSRFMIFIFQVIYCVTLIFVKCSVCFAIYRITTSKMIRGILWALMIISTITGLATLGVLLSVCHPIAEIWLFAPGGYCIATIAQDIKGVIIFSTISAIITDFSCAVVPYAVLWNLQMPQKTKIILATLLGLSFM